MAKLPIVVYEPLTFVVMEQAAGDHAYLHMTLTNTSTLPVALRSPSIVSDIISLTQLHGELPRVSLARSSELLFWRVYSTRNPRGFSCERNSVCYVVHGLVQLLETIDIEMVYVINNCVCTCRYVSK